MTIRIDEFKATPSGELSARDNIRFLSVGFDKVKNKLKLAPLAVFLLRLIWIFRRR